MTAQNNYFTMGSTLVIYIIHFTHTKINISLEGKDRGRKKREKQRKIKVKEKEKTEHEEALLSKYLTMQMRKVMTREVKWLS